MKVLSFGRDNKDFLNADHPGSKRLCAEDKDALYAYGLKPGHFPTEKNLIPSGKAVPVNIDDVYDIYKEERQLLAFVAPLITQHDILSPQGFTKQESEVSGAMAVFVSADKADKRSEDIEKVRSALQLLDKNRLDKSLLNTNLKLLIQA